MKNSTIKTNCFHVALATVAGLSGVCHAESGSQGGTGGESVEVKELRAALALSREEILRLESAAEKGEQQRKALAGSLAEAVRVSEEQMASSREMQLKLQAFGVDLFTRDENSIQQRLLKAVRDLDISRQELEATSTKLHELSEAFLKYLQATPEAPEGERKDAEEAIAAAGEVLGERNSEYEAASPDLSDSRVVSIDGEIGLVVLDAGRENGLRVGTPIAILRGDRPIYSALIVDVRDSISGAVLRDRLGEADDVAVGDGFRLMPHQNNL